jgi:hypothetical protein
MYDITVRKQERTLESTVLIAVTKVFSGTIKLGQKLYVFGPRHQINGQEDI